MDDYFRWFEGEKAQFRFVPYDWAFLFSLADHRTSPLNTVEGLVSNFRIRSVATTEG